MALLQDVLEAFFPDKKGKISQPKENLIPHRLSKIRR